MLLLLSTPKNQYFHPVSLFKCPTECIRTFHTSLLYIFTLAALLQPVQKSAQVDGCTVAQAVLLTFRNKQE
jgi:hypothetical protein